MERPTRLFTGGYGDPVSATTWAVVALVVLLVAVLALVLVLRPPTRTDEFQGRGGRRRPHRNHFRDGSEHLDEGRPMSQAAIIVNPTKFDDVERLRDQVSEACRAAGWDTPLWLETTEDDPGSGQTLKALDAGATIVCPLGGDGTVRLVGSELAGTSTPMGLLPGGTGNLLARNLDLPIDSVRDALQVALTGKNRRIDVCTITVAPTPSPTVEVDDSPTEPEVASGSGHGPQTYDFLVMAGMGFDADIMASTDEDLKAKVGWVAYLVAGIRHLKGKQFKATIVSDDDRFTRRTRSVIVGNVGKLQGGMALMPEAKPDDGLLDTLVLSPQGVVGWAGVAASLVSHHRRGHTRVTHHSTKSVRVTADRPVAVQIDGDVVGDAQLVEVGVRPGALLVRVPA